MCHLYAYSYYFFCKASAESYLNECLATYQAVHGPHHEKTLAIHDEVARLLIRTDRQEVCISYS